MDKMKTLTIKEKREHERGVMVTYEILEDGVIIETGDKLVPRGFDRLLIPMTDGTSALSAYL